ncbi:glycine--tRNA ligase subunit beta [Acidicapsa dinghuensis]|uniref:Glycine--tRNA ligase beta subunit n=1 Tax=Acidicapsa dinghuensis TaxID=2218256 RepID=A0ABW1EJN6_9BACT|nr:glycine--tRNA ligase subunit beta [Acidicapsa dinghuensis]
MAEFLLEIGLEEIPARMITGAEAELGRRIGELIARERLADGDVKIVAYSTPRRLAVRVEGLAQAQPDVQEVLTGPSWKIAFPNGEPGPAAQAFAKKAGVDLSALEKTSNAKGEYVSASVLRKGRATAEVLAAELPKEVLSIYWAKNMYWRAGKPERFVRPVRWVVALLDSEILPIEIAGIKAGNQSRGHRILHGSSPIVIETPGAYLDALRGGFVEADVAVRRNTIRKALDRVTRSITATPGARWREDEALVETVVQLTEWPTVLYGSFEAEYLALPEEVLVTVMRDHQKYFAVEDAAGKLAPHFLTVLNTQVDEAGEAIIRHGNERVLRSRFKDAQFFWETDQKVSLTDRVAMLNAVTFQKDLGSYGWKTQRNLEVIAKLHELLQVRGFTAYDYAALEIAGKLAKADLTAELVKEFTELQGIIGGLYAKAQGLSETAAAAIYSQYVPESTDDVIPETVEGQLLGLADRVHTITAMFSIGNAPTGSRDPFALRRAANAIVKILAESALPLRISDVIAAADSQDSRASAGVHEFFVERLNFYLSDVRGFAYDVVNATLAADADDVRDAIARAEALTAARGSEDFLAISAAFKRIKNILRQAAEKGEVVSTTRPTDGLLSSPEEKALLAQASKIAADVTELRQKKNYLAALEAIASLRPAVDAFFDKVMVMASEAEVRAARLALIRFVLEGLSGIADFSEIVIA